MGTMKLMLFRKLLPLFAVFALIYVSPARAQFAIYGTADGQRFGGINCPTFVAPCAQNAGHVTPYGGTLGVYYDFRDMGPVRLGVDLRGDLLGANKRADSSSGAKGTYRQYTALAGIRASFRGPLPLLHPYAEIAAGMTRNNASGLYTQTTTTYAGSPPPIQETSLSFNPNLYATYPLVKGFAGLDIRILPYLDVRAIEFGIGEAFGSVATVNTVSSTVNANGTVTTGTATTVTSSPTSHLTESIGAGVVFRFP